MENWGLITYRESDLLVLTDEDSASSIKRVAMVIAHEIAHQVLMDNFLPAPATAEHEGKDTMSSLSLLSDPDVSVRLATDAACACGILLCDLAAVVREPCDDGLLGRPLAQRGLRHLLRVHRGLGRPAGPSFVPAAAAPASHWFSGATAANANDRRVPRLMQEEFPALDVWEYFFADVAAPAMRHDWMADTTEPLSMDDTGIGSTEQIESFFNSVPYDKVRGRTSH